MACTMIGCHSLSSTIKKEKSKNAKVNQLGILILHTILSNMASSTFQCQIIILF